MDEIAECGKEAAGLVIIENARRDRWVLDNTPPKPPSTMQDIANIIKSPAWLKKFQDDRAGMSIKVYKICFKPLEQRGWQLDAANEFLSCYSFTFKDGSDGKDAVAGSNHCVIRIASARGRASCQSLLQGAMESALDLSIRTEKP